MSLTSVLFLEQHDLLWSKLFPFHPKEKIDWHYLQNEINGVCICFYNKCSCIANSHEICSWNNTFSHNCVTRSLKSGHWFQHKVQQCFTMSTVSWKDQPHPFPSFWWLFQSRCQVVFYLLSGSNFLTNSYKRLCDLRQLSYPILNFGTLWNGLEGISPTIIFPILQISQKKFFKEFLQLKYI